MDRYKRNCVLDIFDYSKRRLCGLYDSSFDISGQAANVVVTTQRNGWRELSFTQPAICETERGAEENFRLQYLKADYLIRQIDDDEIDWFIISEPRIQHQNFTKNVTVTAGHNSQQLKTKNLGLEFSDEEGNNVGTAEELAATILKGTGWKVGHVDEFYERDEKTIKRRSQQAQAKTGAFKLITQMCDLFDAKPIFHGDSKTVDIRHMNPFSKPKDGRLPDVTQADGVIELHYGHSVSNITRTLNTENVVTKLYAYGSYGDKTSGYCGIDECKHKEYVYTTNEEQQAGVSYSFTPESYSSRTFTPSVNVPAETVLIWSAMDPASMMYIWDEGNALAYPAKSTSANYNEHEYSDNESFATTSSVELPATAEVVEKQNWFSFLLDFSYYYHVGQFTQDMLQKLAEYQRNGAALYEDSHDAMMAYLDTLTDLTEIIGSINFCKLNVESAETFEGYAKLNLAEEKVQYRTDYAEKERDLFAWTPATQINDKGDPTNEVASVIYIVHDTNPVTWDKVYIQAFNDTVTDSQDGIEQNDIDSLLLWSAADEIKIDATDSVYLFELNNINALLGSWEATDEAKMQALEESTKVVTANHPVYFREEAEGLPDLDATSINGYAWSWIYDSSGINDSKMYFYFGDGTDDCYSQSWTPVFYSGSMPTGVAPPAYWFNWAESTGWDTSTLYALTDHGWQKATNEVINGSWILTGDKDLKDIPYDIEDTWKLFGTVYHTCKERDRLYQGYMNYTTYTVEDVELLAGNYYFIDGYGDYYVFTTKENLPTGSTLAYDAFNGWIDQITPDGVHTTIETKKKPFDGVRYNNNEKNMIIVEKEHFRLIQPTVDSGERRGIIEFIRKLKALSDEAYGIRLATYVAAQDEITKLEEDLISVLGDLYREGWWQSEDYVDGDEDKLYEDALDNLEKISQPEASYTINFLDRYEANEDMEYGASSIAAAQKYPDISILSAAHLIDPEINVNVWAYIDKLSKCYDQPWKTTIAINTNQTTMTQHSFTDVLTNIANVANELKGKASVYNRAAVLTTDGKLAAERLEGEINAAKQKIFGGNSTWYTDDAGNLMFVSADGASAMTLTGNGFAIADSKNEWGEWNWRTFGTGSGFSADEITTGFLSSDRIQANSISSYKLDTQTQNILGWVEGSEVRLSEDNLKQTVTDTIASEMEDDNSSLRQSVINQTAESIRMEFNEALTGIESQQETQENVSTWFDFSEDGLKIGAETYDGTDSPFYTLQNNAEYGFYKETTKLASITGEGMDIPQVNVSTLFRLGNLYGIVDEGDAINWVYNPS